jgi:galactose mutarotase-like enzyme
LKLNLEAMTDGSRAIVLESDWLRASVLPTVGAKIYDLVWKPAGRNILWHNPRILPRAYPIDGNFDNYWCGGWDDGFPTCDMCEYRGEQYPNLGELRSVTWQVEAAGEDREKAFVRLFAFGPISPVRAQKTVTLLANAPVLEMRYEITNLGPTPLEFIWGTHPALEAHENLLLRVPAKTGIVGQTTDPVLGTPGQHYAWPKLEAPGGITDMSRVRGIEAKIACGHYATDLEAGWYAVEDIRTGEGFLLTFPLAECPYLWMWLVYGGWRGYHHIIIEPWTSYPNKLADAVRQNTHRTLAPGERFSVQVAATVYRRGEGYGADSEAGGDVMRLSKRVQDV